MRYHQAAEAILWNGPYHPSLRINIGKSYVIGQIMGPERVSSHIKGYEGNVFSVLEFKVQDSMKGNRVATRLVKMAAKEAEKNRAGMMEADILDRRAVMIAEEVFGRENLSFIDAYNGDGKGRLFIDDLYEKQRTMMVIIDLRNLDMSTWETPNYISNPK